MSVSPVPAGYHTVTPYLIVDDAAEALAFYAKAFGAEETMRMPAPDGTKVMHAEFKIGNSMFMMADEFPEMGMVSPKTLGGNASFLHLYMDNVDERFARAIDAGAEEVRPVADQFYGDRMGTLKDPFGYQWTIGTHIEDVTEEEMAARFEKMMQSQSGG